MDDLISRNAAIEAIVSQSIYETREAITKTIHNNYKKSDEWLGGIDDAISTIEEMNTVPAVPLDKLCEWLANSFSDPPCCTLENVRCKMECRGFTQMDYSECWRYVLNRWMEGLDDHNGTD